MKSFDSDLAVEYGSGTRRLAHFIRASLDSGEVFGFTSHDKQVTVGSYDYEPGLSVTNIQLSSGLAVNNNDLTALYDATFVREDFLAGKWDNARWVLFQTSWDDPSIGQNTIGHFVTGDVTPGERSVQIELRALSQFLQQPIGIVTSKTCRARFADYPQAVGGALCRLASSDFIVTGTVTSVTSQQVFVDSARAEVDDWFAEGVLTWASGDNAGLSEKVKTYASDTFTMSLPFPFAVQVGDAYEVIAGCRKRRDEDCVTKFDNVLNFQGEPDLVGIDAATAQPDIDGA